jgi:hypothetical protein
MRALRRYLLAPLAIVAAVLVAAAGPGHHSSAPARSGVALAHGCPGGTNWDTIKQACV